MSQQQQQKLEFQIIRLEPTDIEGNILEEYSVGDAKVIITDKGYYYITEPAVNDDVRNVYSLLMESLFYTLKPFEIIKEKGKEYVIDYLLKAMEEEAKEKGVLNIFKAEEKVIKYYIIRDIVGYGILDVVMKDDNVEEVSLTHYENPVRVYVAKYSQFNYLNTNVRFKQDDLDKFVQKLAYKIGKSITIGKPIVDGIDDDGNRLMLTYKREVTFSSTFTIRKFPNRPSLTKLIASNTISFDACLYVWLLLDAKAVGLIIGGTASGKTTLLNALLTLTNPRWKIATIEETPELLVPHSEWQRMMTRQVFTQEAKDYEIDLMQLIKASLRMRPDMTIVGEIRGEEAFSFIQASATGHGGLCTFHSNDAQTALLRLSAEPINITESYQMLIWFIVTIRRINVKGKMLRRVISIDELTARKDEKEGRIIIDLLNVFKYDPTTDTLVRTYQGITPREKEACSVLNVDYEKDMKRRREILQEAVMKSKTVHEISQVISRYYY
jgi:flagellar protein FlaI